MLKQIFTKHPSSNKINRIEETDSDSGISQLRALFSSITYIGHLMFRPGTSHTVLTCSFLANSAN